MNKRQKKKFRWSLYTGDKDSEVFLSASDTFIRLLFAVRLSSVNRLADDALTVDAALSI